MKDEPQCTVCMLLTVLATRQSDSEERHWGWLEGVRSAAHSGEKLLLLPNSVETPLLPMHVSRESGRLDC